MKNSRFEALKGFLRQKHDISPSYGSIFISSNSGQSEETLMIPSYEEEIIAVPSFKKRFDIRWECGLALNVSPPFNAFTKYILPDTVPIT